MKIFNKSILFIYYQKIMKMKQKIKLPVHIADDPLKSVVRGTGLALKNYQRYPFVMR